jgi:predicted flap endonuclease-1-like 5' DNA nuclease
MRAFKVFIFGLLYGWFIKIAFDRIYHQNDMENLQNENASLQDYIRVLEMRLEPKSLETKSEMRRDQQAAPNDTPASVPAVDPAVTPPPGQENLPVPPNTLGATEELKDDLKIIKGIGPAIERKLNNAGIFSFAALAKLSPQELENILGSQVRRLQNENDLIAQARSLAQGR